MAGLGGHHRGILTAASVGLGLLHNYAPISLHVQTQVLYGRILLVDENGLATPAARVEVTIAETGGSDIADGKGLFRLTLPTAFPPGVQISVDVAKPGWAVWQPEEGKTPIPQGLLTVKLLAKGSKRFWTDHFIQTFIERTARKAKLQVKAANPGERPKRIDFAPMIHE